jgi:hypothetical protein
MQIFAVMSTGRILTIEAESSDTMEKVALNIQDQTGIYWHPDHLRLILKGRQIYGHTPHYVKVGQLNSVYPSHPSAAKVPHMF